MTIDVFIRKNNLKPGDVVKVKKANSESVSHDIVYLGFTGFTHKFVTNIAGRGVDWLTEAELTRLFKVYQPFKIKRFQGSEKARQIRIVRAVRSMKKQAYHLLTNNLEDLKKYGQSDISDSQKIQLLGTGVALAGGLMAVQSEDEGLQVLGLFAAILGAAIALSEENKK